MPKAVPFSSALLYCKLQYLSDISKFGLLGGFTHKKKRGGWAPPGPAGSRHWGNYGVFQTGFRGSNRTWQENEEERRRQRKSVGYGKAGAKIVTER